MNREIKFRAWDAHENNMNYQGAIGAGSSSEVINISFQGEMFLQNAFGLDMFGERNPTFGKSEERFSLMQYTGLKDKNGKEIYEGDIIISNHPIYENGTPSKNKVAFDKGCYRLRNDNQNDIPLSLYDEGQIEIIGNLFENPDILK